MVVRVEVAAVSTLFYFANFVGNNHFGELVAVIERVVANYFSIMGNIHLFKIYAVEECAGSHVWKLVGKLSADKALAVAI